MGEIRIVVAGAGGRMGKALVRAILQDSDCRLAGALEASGHPELGQDVGVRVGGQPAGVTIGCDAEAALSEADALVDFTIPAVSVALARVAARLKTAHVIGTTGFSTSDETGIREAARQTAIVKSGNMSRGVTLLASLVRRAAKALPDFDVEILEMHHGMKADAPSGTALLLGQSAAGARGESLDSQRVIPRNGQTGQRKAGAIGFASLRGGTVVGEHEVILAGPFERVVLKHSAEDRSIFALGAIAAAKWAKGRAPGLYSMADVLGLD